MKEDNFTPQIDQIYWMACPGDTGPSRSVWQNNELDQWVQKTSKYFLPTPRLTNI